MMNTWKIPIVKVIRYRNLAATEVLNNDKMRCNNHDCTDCVLLTKNLSRNICILDSNEFQPESKNLINEILNTAACDNSDEQYIKLDGSTCKNFGLLNTNELNRRIHHRCCNSRKKQSWPCKNCLSRYSKEGNFPCWKWIDRFHKKWVTDFLKKITPIQSIYDDCAVAFTGRWKDNL